MDKMMPCALIPVYKKGKLKKIEKIVFAQCKDCQFSTGEVGNDGCTDCIHEYMVHDAWSVRHVRADWFCGYCKPREEKAND